LALFAIHRFVVHKVPGCHGYVEAAGGCKGWVTGAEIENRMNSPSLVYERIIEPIEDRMIRSVWRITRNAQDAEDAMQNALLAIWKCRHRICRHANPHALVLKVCIDSACDVLRRRMRERRRIEAREPIEQPLDSAPLPSEELAHQELVDEIYAAINQLSYRQTVAFTLRVIEELPYEQIAAAMKCGEATVRKHVERARKQLRVVLAKHKPGRIERSLR
jgi:RNA polymerase sigma factor (sigma-70 family)